MDARRVGRSLHFPGDGFRQYPTRERTPEDQRKKWIRREWQGAQLHDCSSSLAYCAAKRPVGEMKASYPKIAPNENGFFRLTRYLPTPTRS